MIDQYTPLEDAQRTIRLTDSQKNRLVGASCEKVTRWYQGSSDVRGKSLEMWQLYLQNTPDVQQFTTPDAADDSSANIRRPVMAEAIDSIHAQQHLSTYPADESFFSAQPRNEIAQDNQDLYQSYRQERFDQDDFILNTFKDRMNAMMDGVAAVATPFIRKSKMKAVYKFPSIFGLPLTMLKPRKEMVETVVYEGTPFIPLQLEDWWVDPTVDSLDQTNFIWRRWMNVEEVKATEAFENTEDIRPYYTYQDESESDRRTKLEYQGVMPEWTHKGERKDGDAGHLLVAVMEEWGDFWIDDKYYPNHVLIYSNDSTFHYFGPNPYDHGEKPFLVAPYVPVPGTLYGKSAGQDSIPLIHTLDTLLNQYVDIVSNCANPILLYLKQDTALREFFSEGNVTVKPGMAIPVGTLDSIRYLVAEFNNILSTIADMMQGLKEEVRESTGGLPYASGGTSVQDQQRTATETNALVSGTSTRFQNLIQFYEKTKLSPYLPLAFENDRQFMSEPVMVSGFDQPLTPNMVKQMDFSFSVTGSKTIMNRSRDLEIEQGVITTLFPMLVEQGIAITSGEVLQLDIPKAVMNHLHNLKYRDADDIAKVVSSPDQQAEQTSNPAALASLLGGGAPNGIPQVPVPAPGGAPADMAAA